MNPQVASDRRCCHLQVGALVGGFSPGRPWIAGWDRLPGDGIEAVVQLGEEVAAVFMIDKTTEKLLIVGRPQALAQFLGECRR
ncbi:hypothetical protein D3C84_305960 [compost metagenome]